MARKQILLEVAKKPVIQTIVKDDSICIAPHPTNNLGAGGVGRLVPLPRAKAKGV